MKKYRRLSKALVAVAFILSGVMCAFVAWSYRDFLYHIEYSGYSSPAWVTLFYAVPFIIAIVFALVFASIFNKKSMAVELT